MKNVTVLPLCLAPLLLVAGAPSAARPAVLAPTAVAMPSNRILQGRMRLSATEITINESVTYKFDPLRVQCFDFRAHPTACATLVGVGYADRVRVTLAGDTVLRLDILELQQ
jgi:hypothetical protein